MSKKHTERDNGIKTSVEIMRDNSGMTYRDVFAIYLKSDTESIDSLIKKAVKAAKKSEHNENENKHLEWIQ